MKICIAQTKSQKGNVQKNIKNHIQFVERAVKLKSDLIVFPELSLTSYEPQLVNELAIDADNNIFNPFQKLSDENQITISVGMPTIIANDIYISMLIFQPYKEREVYSKQILHTDEVPYFNCGTHQTVIDVKGYKIAFGICYESLQREHFLNTIENNAEIYIASVAKPREGITKAYKHFPAISREFKTPILISNAIGHCDNFMSVGQSAAWNKDGKLIAQLDTKNEGLLIYDTELKTAEVDQSCIDKGQLSDLETLFQIYINGKTELERKGICQWTDNYPTISLIENDLKKGILYVLKNDNEIIGAINISEEQEKEYQSINWKFNESKILVIHRLVVDPKYQKQGYARQLMDFAENFASDNNYTSIRLDAYTQNTRVVQFYKKRGYLISGNVIFPERIEEFYCMEKKVNT
ncbi:carbon-nitrogen hydrolase family protein [Flavobacteriales bacterium ALC-1]|nr:carbon-nitrogen hydrolase family protein [Flavobacteriales bacterium ALC-1]